MSRITRLFHTIGRSTFVTKEVRGFFCLFLVSGIIPGAVFLTSLNPLGNIIGSKKIGIRENLAKEKIVFSPKSSHAIFKWLTCSSFS